MSATSTRDGHFYITDRLKDLFKLSNGKYVAPLQVESLLKQSPLDLTGRSSSARAANRSAR